MHLDPINIPVTLKPSVADVVGNVFNVEGFLRYEEGELSFEFQILNVQMERGSVRSLRMELKEIQEITFRSGLFTGTVITIRPRSLALLDGIPGERADGLVLNVARKYREEAEMLVSQVRLGLSESKLERWG